MANNSDLHHIVNHSQNHSQKALAPIRPFPLDLSSPNPTPYFPTKSPHVTSLGVGTFTSRHPSFGSVATAQPSDPKAVAAVVAAPPVVDEEANFTRVISQDFLRLSVPQPLTDLEK